MTKLKLGLNPGAIWMVSLKEKIRTWTTHVGDPAVGKLPANAGDTVRSLAQEDSARPGAIYPVSHNYWAHMT